MRVVSSGFSCVDLVNAVRWVASQIDADLRPWEPDRDTGLIFIRDSIEDGDDADRDVAGSLIGLAIEAYFGPDSSVVNFIYDTELDAPYDPLGSLFFAAGFECYGEENSRAIEWLKAIQRADIGERMDAAGCIAFADSSAGVVGDAANPPPLDYWRQSLPSRPFKEKLRWFDDTYRLNASFRMLYEDGENGGDGEEEAFECGSLP